MRIDYSEPKKSYSSSPQVSQNRPRKKSSGGLLAAVVIMSIVSFGIGFGSGWMLSQRSAKNGFKAAMEQQSLENSPQQDNSQKSPQQPVTAAPAQPPQTTAANETQVTANPPLSFYKTLPSGQKNNVLGSGINSTDGKPAKQPLQAAIPSNLSKPAPAKNDENAPKQPAQAPAAKPASRQDSNGLTVQVASYSLRSEAEAERSKLAAKGYNATITEFNLGDKGIWYRIRIGKRLDPDAAKELATKLGKGAIAVPDKD